LPLEQGYSFPSTPSTWYRATAELLADLITEWRNRLVAVGSQAVTAVCSVGCTVPVTRKRVSASVWRQRLS
jgi:hypothetical protein